MLNNIVPGSFKMWTLSGTTDNCDYTVSMDITDGTYRAIYKNIYWNSSYCNQDQDQYNGYYRYHYFSTDIIPEMTIWNVSFDAVRMPWRTAFDASYLGNTNSTTRCNKLVTGPFISKGTIDGQKFVPSGNS